MKTKIKARRNKEPIELKNTLIDVINTWGMKNILTTLIVILAERYSDDKYIVLLLDNLKKTLNDYEGRYETELI